MRYTKFQKFLSSFLIFSLLSGITFKIPFFDFLVSASWNEYYDLVSIIVDEETYSDIDSELKRYSKDISNSLENTKVIILPVPKDATSYDIASMNESLFFEWYKSLSDVNFESKLVWTVLVWNIPLPIVYKDNELSKTILPYTDFEDKSYIYNLDNSKYEYNKSNISWIKSEIWHWIISPNTWDDWDNIDALKDYFDKNHDYYTWEWLYNIDKNSINWDLAEDLNSNYEPYVFYFDSFRESQSLNYSSYIWYKWYLENKEDIVYNRYTKDLANKLKSEILWSSENILSDLAKKVDPSLDKNTIKSVDTSLDNVPDIQSRYIINNSVKKFLEIFSPWSISELRKNVYNAGRYNYWQDVNADFIPYFISVLDIVNDQIIKEMNDDLEVQIDNLVSNWLSRKIAIPTIYNYSSGWQKEVYENYLFWKKASSISSAEQCTYYRWSTFNWWQLVEANRWNNIHNIEPDKNTISPFWTVCFTNLQSSKSLDGFWWKNSPFNLNQEESKKWNITLNNNLDYKWAILPLYDIDWSKKITNSEKNPSPYFCSDNNYLLADKWEYVSSHSDLSTFENTYKIPTYLSNSINKSVPWWSCITDTNLDKTYNYSNTFDQNFLTLSAWTCEKKTIKLNWSSDSNIVKEISYTEAIYWDTYECSSYTVNNSEWVSTTTPSSWKNHIYEYKTIDSFIKHKSPNSSELSSQIDSMVAPSLPVDKDRYIDFISADGSYEKINYPYLYRLKLENIKDISLDKVSLELDKLLDEKSSEINKIISENNPNNGRNKTTTSKFINNPQINNFLKTWNYPNANFDLKKYLKNKWNKNISLDGETKELSYYDMLVFSIYWNNLNSVSAKYWYVFENYLSNQFWNENKYFLPKNKSWYEIAYLWSSWDSSNMFIWLDPESKNSNPYTDIISKNQDLSTKLLWLNIWTSKTKNEGVFKCAPPEWVPIWEWIPAIMCRLWDMMPPTISISDWACWPSLLSNEEKVELNSCNWDVNKNWVNDCIETKLSSWKILLESDSNKYYYNKQVELKATLKWNDDKTLSFLNSTNIDFEIIKVEVPKDDKKDLSDINTKLIYDINDIYKKDKSVLSQYLYFNNYSVRSTSWISKYWITLKDKDINVYLKASVKVKDKNEEFAVDLDSNILKIEVRWDRLFSSTYNLENKDSKLIVNPWKSSVLASDKANIYLIDWYNSTIDSTLNLINNNSTSQEKLVIKLDNISKSWEFIKNSYPIKLELYNNNNLIEEVSLNQLSWIKPIYTIKKSWTYLLKIKDNFWSYLEKTFEVLPNSPEKIDLNLSTNFLQTGWAISTNFVTILDKFDNPVTWKFFDLKMKSDGNSVVFFDNDKSDFTTTTYEWYKIFRLKSTNKSGKDDIEISLIDDSWKVLLKNSKKISILDNFNIETKSQSWDFYVWWGSYKYQIDIKDKSWKIINDFNSRVYISVNNNYLELNKPYFEIINWSWVVEFKTKNTSWKNIPLQIQLEWLSDITTKNIDIFPDKAIKLDLILSKSKLEANTKDYSNVNIELKDRYNNLVFTDSSTNLDIEILPQYKHLISYDKKNTTAVNGKANFKIYSTINPWVWYFKVNTNPSLSLNSFLIEDENWKLNVAWVWENSAKIESFYVWNKAKIENSSYNSIYTTLLWANYWDLDQKDYLAGSLIFDKNSKALAVTSTLNNPYSHNNILSVSNKWGILKMYSNNDLTQDLSMNVWFKDSKIYLDLFNSSLNTHIWEINYNFPNNTKLSVCDKDSKSCVLNEKTTIFWKKIVDDFNFYIADSKLIFRDNLWKTYFEVDDNWNIIRKSNISFEVLSNSNNYLELNLKIWDKLVWILWFNFVNSDLNVTRDKVVFDNKLKNLTNSVLVYIDSSFYWSYSNWKWDNESLIIYYNDPFSSDKSLNTFSKDNLSSYENFKEVWWLWWSGWNKTLLSFSSWKTVWESLKDFMSFSSVNIGDPVISLKKIRKNFNNSSDLKQFDSTIWDIISNESWLEWYRVFDYNNDKKQDILLIKNDWYLKLLENSDIWSNFLDHWNLANLIDLWNNELIKTWDFTWDSYEDIFFVWEDWKPYLLNNINKDFSRISLYNKFSLNWRIIRAESFDMDNDSIDDIVTLDDSWEINIFYWKWTSVNPNFTKLNVTDNYWITLNSDKRNDGWLIYFDWLYQVDNTYNNSNILKENKDYLSNISQWNNFWVKNTPDEDLINSFIFEQIAYSKKDSFNKVDSKQINSLLNLPDTIEQTTFIKSDYSESSWLKVDKILLDRNWWYLSKWDYVDVDIEITNISWRTINNIAYIEDIFEYFTIDESSLLNSKNLQFKKPNWSYELLVDGFSLSSNESIKINYSWIVKPLKYSHMQVWLFEKWEEWDDSYWDIILKDSLENCSDPVEIFRSVSTRLYNKWVKDPVCDNTKLPEAIEKNNLDSDDDWIPDYIENLTTNNQALKDYSEKTLSNLFKDSDSDWIPDDEDSFNLSQSLNLDLWETWKNIDKWLDNLQSLVNWLSCWFNNGSCISMPLNRAPLAPWNDPVFNWKLLGDGLNIDEWIPIFSALTWMPIYVPACVPIPTVWPVSSSAVTSACSKTYFWMDWAWGILWVNSPTNFFRLSVTPTLTWWVWMSACFWAPASVAWRAMMPWISPLFPWGNCIVVAKPIVWCSNDWSDWNPASIWNPIYGNSFWVINWNCSKEDSYSVDKNYVNDYYSYLKWNKSYNNLPSINKAVSNHWSTWSWPLFQIWWVWSSWTPISVWVDSSWNVDFSDVTKLVNKRIKSFPWFLMNWVTRQIEEIVSKLTDFPTLFIIFPDFSWIYDSDLDWETNKQNWLKNSWNKDRTSSDAINFDNISSNIDSSKIKNETLKWLANDANNLTSDAVTKAKQYSSWIKDAYEFIGSLPLVKIEQAPVDISLPWVSLSEIDKSISTRQATLDSWKKEYERAKNSWSLWKACNYADTVKQKQCNDDNALSEKVMLDTSALIMSLEANIEVLKSYKEIPEKINKYINKKEYYLEQILCNIESISSILWWRIWKNWERFKSWVELFVLIKAILKSWQLLIDVFVDYEQECKQCKNERQDSISSEFELISMVVPDIPVIQFPKWPDIILDLHNIRASLNIMLPEFNITPRPILLPELPNLYLPDAPNVNISFPSVPVLPKLEIPELPDLPSLPTVELPDLPPPPTLPKMFASLEAILDILKLVTKAMCILKSSPFVPEWRAWDQIAFLTERSWFLPTDFLNVSLPQFSFPFIDAIKVTTYVNLEFDTDFIVELARQTAMPINSFTADFTNMFNIDIADLDFRGVVPSDINIDIWEQKVNPWVWYNQDDSIKNLVISIVARNLLFWREYISKNKEVTVSNLDFKKEISKSLASKDFSSDPRFDELRNLWRNVSDYTFSSENKSIDNLKENNFDKFETVKDIINTEIIKNKEFKSDFNKSLNSNIRKVSLTEKSNVKDYNTLLDKYNSVVFEKTSSIINSNWENIYKEELKNIWDNLLTKVDTALGKYTKASDITNSKLLAANLDIWKNIESNVNSCNSKDESDAWYVYEWIYILENNKSYRLFDYKDELTWSEDTTIIDFDNDKDEDLLYFANNTLYLKENLDKKDNKNYLNQSPIILDFKDNKFLNNKTYISSVNNATSNTSTSWIINISFLATKNINNYRLSFYSVVDKFLNEKFPDYFPKFKKKSLVDAISWIWQINLSSENEVYNELKDIVTIKEVWDLRGIEAYVDEMVNIKDNLNNWNVVSISNGTKIYSWDSSMVLKYLIQWSPEIKSLIIPKNRHLETKITINVVWITWNWFIKTWAKKAYLWTEIRNLIWKPLLPGSKIQYIWNNFEVRDDTYLELEYYDGSKLDLDFEYILDWELYDLWYTSDKYLISISKDNDFYYSKINSFKENINSTLSNQVLLSPQLQSDKNPPELDIKSVKVPVYQKQIIDLTKYIYEDSWIDWIKSIYMDFDLSLDTSWDWNPKNDNDSGVMPNIKFFKQNNNLFLEVWVFENLHNKRVWITIIDSNWNIWYKEISFEIYSPIPEIDSHKNDNISGYINEKLTNEPVSIYRIRWWMVSKLWDKSWVNYSLSNSWSYQFNLPNNSDWLKIEKNKAIIANVNEKTWKITLKNNSYFIDVLESNNSKNNNIYPKILIRNDLEEIFYENISVVWSKSVKVVNNFDSINWSWIYVQFLNQSNYNYYIVPENVSYNPWSLSIYRIADENKEPLFTIFNDGRINTINSNYSLKYDYFDNYVVIKLYDKNFSRDIASVLYKVDSDYIIK